MPKMDIKVLLKYAEDFHSSPSFNFFTLLLLLFSFFVFIKLTKSSKYKLPPSPPKLPIIGNLHQLGSLPHRTFSALSDKYGPLLLVHMGQSPVLVVSSHEIVREIMKTHDIIFANRYKTGAADVLFYGGNELVFSPHGEHWREVRKVYVSELLSQKRLQLFHLNRKREVKILVAKIRRSCDSGQVPVNLGEMLHSILIIILCEFAFGGQYGGEEYGKQFGRLSQSISKLLLAISFREFFPFIGWMDKFTGFDARVGETWKEVNAFLDQVIKEHEDSMTSKSEKSEVKDCVDVLLNLRNNGMAGIDLSLDVIKGIILDLLTGGNDTTAATMEWVMAELAKSPTAMKKAREEVRRVVGKKMEIDLDDICQMEYLRCVIKETLRLHPPAPLMLPRQTSAHVELKSYDIPPRTTVFINLWAIQRDPQIWDMPEEFRPERFLDNPVDFMGQHFEYTPFGGGRRRCPGMSLSLIIVESVIANLLYWFDWDLPEGNDIDMSEAEGVIVYKKIPLHLVPTPYGP